MTTALAKPTAWRPRFLPKESKPSQQDYQRLADAWYFLIDGMEHVCDCDFFDNVNVFQLQGLATKARLAICKMRVLHDAEWAISEKCLNILIELGTAFREQSMCGLVIAYIHACRMNDTVQRIGT